MQPSSKQLYIRCAGLTTMGLSSIQNSQCDQKMLMKLIVEGLIARYTISGRLSGRKPKTKDAIALKLKWLISIGPTI